jgi:hypothetical protein
VGDYERVGVWQDELAKFGCPYCGYQSGTMPIQSAGWGAWSCGDCDRGCDVYAAGVDLHWISQGFNPVPKLPRRHPRHGTPSHGRADTRPGEGEYFRPRGIGFDVTPGCFVCGKNRPEGYYNHNIAAFVQCKAAGERVVAMFKHGARLDYRENYPDRVQVKVGSCDEHLPNLEMLLKKTQKGSLIPGDLEACLGQAMG